ncbi:transposase [Streptomyces sp. NPDC051546]|uniref:transposase n=1 Tax=Streptomyces sp. NPDC051546 TaxID=3365655 RepID=UPI00379941C2
MKRAVDVVKVGDRIRFEDQVHVLAGLDGPRCRLLAEEDASVQVLLLTQVLQAPDFDVVDHPRSACQRVPVHGPLDGLGPEVRDKALAWERHILEVETGHIGPRQDWPPRPGYDPAMHSLAEREAAKAAELTAAGQVVSVATVRRMRARYREEGVWGLVDGRRKRERSVFGQADPRVVAAITGALTEQRGRSTGTLSRLRRQVAWLLQDTHGTEGVAVPPPSTFNRLVRAVAEQQGLALTAAGERRRASRPVPVFTPTHAMAPGELVMMDSTLLDVMVVCEDGKARRPELTMAVDVATRSITAAVLRPKGTKAVDAAVLLAQTLVPQQMRPNWPQYLSMAASVIPHQRLVSIDARMHGAAARPVIRPTTVVIDQGKVFVSRCFLAAAEHLGISVQPCPPASGHAKAQVERGFGAIGTLFAQYVAGYTGNSLDARGSNVEDQARWTLPQLQDLLDEWVVCGWQERRHERLRHPLMPRLTLTPNEMWAALVAIAGHVPVPLAAADWIELLPSRRCAIGDEGIRFEHRTYDGPVLKGHRHRSTAADGKWEVHHNPYEPWQCWVRLPHGWEPVPWIHQRLVSRPFTDTAWRHIRRVVKQRQGRAEHEEQLARHLDQLLRRAHAADTGVSSIGGSSPAESTPGAPDTAASAGASGKPSKTGRPAPSRRKTQAGHTKRRKAVTDLPGNQAGQIPDADEDYGTTPDITDSVTSAAAWNIFDAHQEAQQW